jgi:hypothetical protein
MNDSVVSGLIKYHAELAGENTAVYCLTAAMFILECTIGPSWAVPMGAPAMKFDP